MNNTENATEPLTSSAGLRGVINIEGFGPAVKVAAVYDRSQPIKCPVCGRLGMRWGGWFTCDWTGKHIVELQSGDVYVAAA